VPVITPRIRLRRSRKGESAFAAKSIDDRLLNLNPISNNPGNLLARYHVPKKLEHPAPLVVVLHGCTQNAAVYDHGSGWSKLADRHGFILLFPEQQRSNNPMLCFNWFESSDTTRGRGEAASIRSMIDEIAKKHEVDQKRIFITGLSAGGAMASVMLATYPDVFAAGAIIAGVPYGCANGVAQAFDCMGGRSPAGAGELGEAVRAASSHDGPWPRVQVWQGSADRTVVASNAEAIVRQWAEVHGLSDRSPRIDQVEGHVRRLWTGADETPLLEHYEIAGMAHGVPLDPGTAKGQSGVAGAHMLDVGLSSTDRIAEFFGIDRESETASAERVAAQSITPRAPETRKATRGDRSKPAAGSLQTVIEEALRTAGLLR
jgi:poly(hydroxyalkanoate) depolymerase family esterase